jgi:hypothetical protein
LSGQQAAGEYAGESPKGVEPVPLAILAKAVIQQ